MHEHIFFQQHFIDILGQNGNSIKQHTSNTCIAVSIRKGLSALPRDFSLLSDSDAQRHLIVSRRRGRRGGGLGRRNVLSPLPSPNTLTHIQDAKRVRSFTLESLRKKGSGGKEQLAFVSAYPVTIATTVLGYRPNDTIDCGLL